MDQPDFDSKDIYLCNGEDVIGLHTIGDKTETGFYQMEAWCNLYTSEWKFLRSIYRISGPIEDEATSLKEEGWVEIKKPEGVK